MIDRVGIVLHVSQVIPAMARAVTVRTVAIYGMVTIDSALVRALLIV